MSSKASQHEKPSGTRPTKSKVPSSATSTADEKELEQEQEPKSQRELVFDLLRKMQQKFEEPGQAKASVADYIRLLQLHADMEDEMPREIEVRWIETPAESSTDETSTTAHSRRKRDSTQ